MSDFNEIRAHFREQEPVQPRSGNSLAALLALAACGVSIGFTALWLAPQISPVSLSSLLRAITTYWGSRVQGQRSGPPYTTIRRKRSSRRGDRCG